MPVTHRYRLTLRRDDAGVWVCLEHGRGVVRRGPFSTETMAEREGRWPLIQRWIGRAHAIGGHVLRLSDSRVFVVLPEERSPRLPGLIMDERPCSVASVTKQP